VSEPPQDEAAERFESSIARDDDADLFEIE